MLPHLEPLAGLSVEELKPRHIDEWLHILKSPAWMKKYSSKRESLEKKYSLLKSAVAWYIDRTDDTKLISPFKKRHQQMLRVLA